ncbi:MAG: hypothetical protein V9G19_14515 [Tetrasphaera sp.]
MSARRALLAAALCAVVLLTGCLGIRADDAIRVGLDVQEPAAAPVYYLPAGPREGASPEEIIAGFLHADEVSGERLTIAQSYLTRRLVGSWDPSIRTDVIDAAGRPDIHAQSGGWYEISADLVATIDGAGRMQASAPGSRARLSVQLKRVGGEYRIDATSAGFGRWVRANVLDQVLRPVSLNYPAVGMRTLIPDIRWLPVTGLATGLARAQFGPPPSYLDGAVETGLASARLSVDAVPVRAGVATVTLASRPAYADPRTRAMVWAQLAATLSQAAAITGVEVSVEGAALDAPGVTPPLASASVLGFEPVMVAAGVKPLVRIGGQLHPVDVAALTSPGLDAAVTASPFPRILPAWNRVALSADGREVAAVGTNGDGLARYRQDVSVEVAGFADRLTGPTYDRFGMLWVGGRPLDPATVGRLWWLDASAASLAAGDNAAAQPIAASWLVDRLAVAVAFPADGARIAVISTRADGSDSRLDVAGVTRNAAGAPTAITGTSLRLGAPLVELRDLVWISDRELAVLAGAEDRVRPFEVTLGDEIRELPPLAGATSITTIGGGRGLVIGTADGPYVRAGNRWQALPEAAEELVAAAR